MYDVLNIKNDAISADSLLRRETARRAYSTTKPQGTISDAIIAQNNGTVNQKLSIRTDNLSDREILANSFEGIAANDNERKYIAQYRTQIDELYKRQQRLAELRDELKREKKVKKPDKARIAKLNTEINAIADLVNRADKRLLAFAGCAGARTPKSSERTHGNHGFLFVFIPSHLALPCVGK